MTNEFTSLQGDTLAQAVSQTIAELSAFRKSLLERQVIIEQQLGQFAAIEKQLQTLLRADAGPDDRQADKPADKPSDKPAAKQTSVSEADRKRVGAFLKYLRGRGGENQWLSLSISHLKTALGIKSDPTLLSAVRIAEAEGSLRVHRAKKGARQTNAYTLSPDLPAPEPVQDAEPVIQDKPAAQRAVDGQTVKLVRDRFREICERQKTTTFSFEMKILAEKMGIEASKFAAAIRELEGDGSLQVTKLNRSRWEYFIWMPRPVAGKGRNHAG